MWRQVLFAATLASASFGAWAASGRADTYPVRPIRIIDGFAPGGGGDYLARVIGPKLTERFGQNVVVDNRPGAASNVAAEIAARANPDGYTLLMAISTILASSRSLYPRLGYDLIRDFAYVSRVATGAQVLVAHPSIAAKSVAELVNLARSQPKAIRYGSSGVASPSHLAVELLQSRTGIQLVHVPYKGAGLSVVALTSGEVQLLFASVTAVMPMLQAKRLNALAVASAKRMETLPDVPTVAESGFPGFDVTYTYGIVAPAGTPDAVVKLLNAELRRIVQMDDVKAKFISQGTEATGSTPEEFRAVMQAEINQWARVIKDANITAN